MEAFTALFSDFDFAALLPKLDTFLGQVAFWTRLALLAGPVVLLCAGLLYFFRPSSSPKSRIGFRSYVTTGSVEVWRFAQRVAGMVYIGLGGGLTVIFLILSLFFGAMDPLAMVTTALVCIIVFAVLVLAAFGMAGMWAAVFADVGVALLCVLNAMRAMR